MKLINYVGTEGPSIVIERPEDLYPYLDYFHTKMCEMGDSLKFGKKPLQCAYFIGKVMELAENNGFGNQDDIDNIEY